jgi:hypothetical protein
VATTSSGVGTKSLIRRCPQPPAGTLAAPDLEERGDEEREDAAEPLHHHDMDTPRHEEDDASWTSREQSSRGWAPSVPLQERMGAVSTTPRKDGCHLGAYLTIGGPPVPLCHLLATAACLAMQPAGGRIATALPSRTGLDLRPINKWREREEESKWIRMEERMCYVYFNLR